jgi:hypothetical protein
LQEKKEDYFKLSTFGYKMTWGLIQMILNTYHIHLKLKQEKKII